MWILDLVEQYSAALLYVQDTFCIRGRHNFLSCYKLSFSCFCLVPAGVDPSLQIDNRIQASSQALLPGSKHNKSRAANTRDERFRSGNHVPMLPESFKCPALFFYAVAKLVLMCLLDLHTEAVQAALAKYKERKMPMPSKRRSVLVQSSVEACTPPGETTIPVYPLFTKGRLYPLHTQPRLRLTLGCLHVFSRAMECRMLTVCCVQ